MYNYRGKYSGVIKFQFSFLAREICPCSKCYLWYLKLNFHLKGCTQAINYVPVSSRLCIFWIILGNVFIVLIVVTMFRVTLIRSSTLRIPRISGQILRACFIVAIYSAIQYALRSSNPIWQNVFIKRWKPHFFKYKFI